MRSEFLLCGRSTADPTYQRYPPQPVLSCAGYEPEPAQTARHDANFAAAVEASRLLDPMPTFAQLSERTGIPVEQLVHHALVRWASAGSEALMSLEPRVLTELIGAREQEDWPKVAGIIDWLAAGLVDTAWR
ncbi:MAG: DUF6027 family protein [Candidatus Dormibacteria bacterium]